MHLQVHLARLAHRAHVGDQRARAPAAGLARLAAQRPRDQRVRGDVADQVVAADHLAPLAVVEERVAGRVPGAVEHLQGAVGEVELRAVGERVRHLGRSAPGAERARHRAQRGHDVARDAVAQHQRLGELVVALGMVREVLDQRREQVERADLRVRAAGEDVDQAEVVDVLMGDHDPLEVLDAVAVVAQRALELVQRLAAVGPDVDDRQRVVLDQVAVDPADHERRRDRERVDHERMRPSTSSRLASMSACDTSDSSVQAQERLGVGGAHVEVPVVVVDRDAVELGRGRRRRSAAGSAPASPPDPSTSELISPEMKYFAR